MNLSVPLFAAANFEQFLQFTLQGLSQGSLFALIALGYTMVYGIVELINFAHGDLFMLGCFLTLTLIGLLGLGDASPLLTTLGILAMLAIVPAFCALLNMGVDRFVYRPLRRAPKLAPLVSAIGVSFIFMNIGMIWPIATRDEGQLEVHLSREIKHDVPDLIVNITGSSTAKDVLVIAITVPIMIALTLFVKYTRLGKAMRATAQNPVAAQLMGIAVDRVIAATFAIGGALAGAGSVIYCLYINSVDFQMGFQNGLYAFTAAVLGGIGNIPGAVLGGILIGLIRAIGSGYVSQEWNSALVFIVLILILVFRPTGLLGTRTREKV